MRSALSLMPPSPAAERLADRLRRGRLPPLACAELGLGVVAALEPLHAEGRVFGALRPDSVWLTRDGSVTLERAPAPAPAGRELSYVAPEQTGRVEHAVDARADYYALGVLLYEAATGAPPLGVDSPRALDVVHAHVARVPRPPADVPRGLAALILRLLAKAPEDRYQTGPGLAADLRACARAIAAGRPDEDVPLGAFDRAAQLALPERLYGRDRELVAIEDALALAAVGRAPLVVVDGVSGVGKSALVAAARARVESRGGCFAAGKFDQLRRSGPYSALVQALRALVFSALASPPARRADAERALTQALGGDAPWLSSVVPEAQALLGPSTTPPRTSPAETQVRVVRALSRALCAVSAGYEGPLLLFVDDLQWADLATLEVIRALLLDERGSRVLVVCARRLEAPDAPGAHDALVSDLRHLGVDVRGLTLGPLTAADSAALVGDTLGDAPGAAALAALLHQRTGGNPFFVGQLLSSMAAHRLLRFDAVVGHWTWDLEAVERAPREGGVLELIMERLTRLSPPTRALLATASALGHQFDADTLAAVTERPAREVAEALAIAARDGFLDRLPGDGAAFAFAHDRVQQAAAAPLGEDLGPLHASIAEKLLARAPDGGDAVTIASHAAAGVRALRDADAPRFADILLRAARAARGAAAFAQSAEYGERALELMARTATADPAQAFDALLEVAECLGAAGELERAFAAAASAAERARTPRQAARASATEAVLATIAHRHERAIDAALRGLALLGISLSRRPPKARVVVGLLRVKLALAGRADAELEALPPMEDPDASLAVELLLAAMAALFQTGDLDLFALCCFEVVRATLRHGAAAGSGFGFVCYAMVTVTAIQDYPAAARFGRIGLGLAERHGDGGDRCRAGMVHGMFVQHWTEPRGSAEEPLARARAFGLEAGETAYAGYTYGYYLDASSIGPSMDEIEAVLEVGQAFMSRSGDVAAAGFTQALRALYAHPRGAPSGDPAATGMTDAIFERLSLSWRYWWFAHMLLVGTVMERDDWIAAARAGCRAHAAGSACAWLLVIEAAYGALAAARAYPAAPASARRSLRAELSRARRFLARWSRACPSSGPAYLALAEGAAAEVRGETARALDRYEAAVEGARALTHHPLALVAARAGARVAAAAGRAFAAEAFAARAREAAAAWGARGTLEADRSNATPGAPDALQRADAEAVALSLQALSGEPSLGRSIDAVLDAAIRATGATRCALVRPHRGAWRAVALAEVTGEEVQVRHAPGDVTLPQAILQYAAAREGPLLLADARAAPELRQDVYVLDHASRAMMVVPIARHGRTWGQLLLENELVAGAFSSARVAAIAPLSAHIAVALENAELYEHLKEKNDALAVALEDARSAARAKGVLLANVSHELRTPLNGVVAVVDMLGELPLGDEPRALVRSLEEASEQLVRSVGGLIAFTEVESGSLRLEVAPFDAARMLERAVDAQRKRAEAKGLRLTLEREALPAALRGDSVRLAHAVGQLLHNAIAFTAQGQVIVRAHGRAEGARTALSIEVTDTGCGMSPQVLAHAFDVLAQADSSRTKAHGGLGIGLPWVRRTIELMGGRVSLRSQEGAGTTALIEVSLERPPEAARPPPPPTPAQVVERDLVLVAEDNVVNQRVLTMMLGKLGLPYRVCADGVEAVAAYRAEGVRVRCVLMDCQMPNMDGLEATLQIRSEERARGWARVPVVAVTANALATDRDRCLDAGMDEFIAKPIRLPALQAALALRAR